LYLLHAPPRVSLDLRHGHPLRVLRQKGHCRLRAVAVLFISL
jgi:hypothetical protein